MTTPRDPLYRRLLRPVYRSFLFKPLRDLVVRLEQSTAEARQETQIWGETVRGELDRLREQVQAQGVAVADLDRLVTDLAAPALSTYAAITAQDQQAFLEQVGENYRDLMNPFAYYRDLIDALAVAEGVRVVPLAELHTAAPEGQRLLALRHDVDADPWTAVRAAHYLARQGVVGSFFLLHTALYYGSFHGALFVRNPEVARWVEALIVAGCEIGLHNDALGAHLRPGVDGVRAMVTEIRWLRSLGARITGTVGHNSAPSYGAENSEVFAGRRLWPRDARSPDGRPLPLETVCEDDLELRYEGTYARAKAPPDVEAADDFCRAREEAGVRNEPWMRRYLLDNPCCEWASDFQFWLIGRDEWVVAGRSEGETVFDWKVGLEQVIERVGRLPAGSRSVFVVHPVFVRE